jgi:hypothetical protein
MKAKVLPVAMDSGGLPPSKVFWGKIKIDKTGNPTNIKKKQTETLLLRDLSLL